MLQWIGGIIEFLIILWIINKLINTKTVRRYADERNLTAKQKLRRVQRGNTVSTTEHSKPATEPTADATDSTSGDSLSHIASKKWDVPG